MSEPRAYTLTEDELKAVIDTTAAAAVATLAGAALRNKGHIEGFSLIPIADHLRDFVAELMVSLDIKVKVRPEQPKA